MTKTMTTRLAVLMAATVAAVSLQAAVVPARKATLTVHVWESTQGRRESIPGATAELSDPKNAFPKRTLQTDLDGVAIFDGVPLGQGYVITAAATRYVPSGTRTVPVIAGTNPIVEIELHPTRQEAIDVAARPIVEVAKAEETTVLGKEFYNDLPVYGRDYRTALVLAPGVVDADADGNVTVHGSRARDFKVTVDGVSNVNPLTGERLTSTGTEAYSHRIDNWFVPAQRTPLSTFSIDVDTASYTNVRRFLNDGELPPPDAVRIEELLNYFRYDDPVPVAGEPFSVATELAVCPWQPGHKLLRIGLRATPIHYVERKRGNFVFLIDVSGSMDEPDKLPLVVYALKMLSRQMSRSDRVAIVVYAGAAGRVLQSTTDQVAIEAALNRLQAGGSTAGGEGIDLAYRIAANNFIAGGVNRVILATDGDFNVGVSSEGELVRLIEEKAKTGVFLSVLGFGTGNLQDSKMEQLADHGNGQYAYIDSDLEARRAMVEEAGGTLVTLAKDVKIQVEFNPAAVASYRLIGYENRMLAAEDFRDDTKDAGEIGAGHSVTALYELTPPGTEKDARAVDALKYSRPITGPGSNASEVATVKLRFKAPDADTSVERSVVVPNQPASLSAASSELRFAAGVAAFGMVLRDSPERGNASFELATQLASAGVSRDTSGRRSEFLALIGKAAALRPRKF